MNIDRDLVTRIVIASLLVIGFIAASVQEFHVQVIGPLAVLGVCVVMFWPRHADDEPELAAHPENSGRVE